MMSTLTIELPQRLATELDNRQVSTHNLQTFVVEAVKQWLETGAISPTQLEIFLHPLFKDDEAAIGALPDQQLLALCDLQWSASQQAILSDLLTRQREGQLEDEGLKHLDRLMARYDRDLLHKAQAISVAVKRGLRSPISQ
ncbi:hypothetical protein QUF58_07140 [Anaerolineales bacterium HSG24]|nr:hypothetical protein [Anaerolineales bacterium HSG24]